MKDFSKRIPDLLERVTGRIRALTVDRMAKGLTIAAAALIAVTLVLTAVHFLFVGLFRILGELVNDMELAYAIIGGLFLIGGVLLWSKRLAKQTEDST